MKELQKKEGDSQTKPARIVLASSSPRRLHLLQSIELEFDVLPSDKEEIMDESIPAQELVTNLARQKAEDVFARHCQDEKNVIVIGADTMVVLSGKLLGKPVDDADAKEMLSKLSACTHTVFTGVHILSRRNGSPPSSLAAVEESKVTFRNLAEREIEAYIQTREPMDKAGAYALQGIGSALVARVDGCYTNVIGLPIPRVVSMLRELGVCILGLPTYQDDLSK